MAKRATFISPLEGSCFSSLGSATSHVDYQPHFGAVRVKAVSPPPPSSVFHRDATLIVGTSLSRSTYCAPLSRCEPAARIDRHKMYATNFSTNIDRRAPVARTTNHCYYHRPPIPVQRAVPAKKGIRNPLGIRIILPNLESEYAGTFATSPKLVASAVRHDGSCASRNPILGKCECGRVCLH